MTVLTLPKSPRIQEFGDHIYITSPVQLHQPDDAEIQQFAFAQDVKGSAPNPKIMWLRGQYVEADEANRNGDQWTAGELAIKALTPVLMPITVMHDLRSAVGTIADAKLRTPDADGVPRARIDTVLALWAHRFPDVAEEARVNASQGTLMQSMECVSPAYDCSVCGSTYHRLPRGAEREHWCAHLRGDHGAYRAGESFASAVARILRSVTFTGVGLIFGTRGARGAYPDAFLEVEELAAFHREAHTGTATKPKRRKGVMEIEDTKYQELVASETTAKAKVVDLEAKLAEAERNVEAAEAAKVTAEEERDAAKKDADDAKEAARVAEMRDERLASLGSAFREKLDKLETTKKLVHRQAGEMSEEDWKGRLAELSETLGVAHDKDKGGKDGGEGGKDGEDGEDGEDGSTAATLFERTEITASAVNGDGNGDGAQAPSPVARQSVIGGLARRPKRTPAKA